MSRLIDLTGQRFGKLVVLSRAEEYVSPSGKHAGEVNSKKKNKRKYSVNIKNYSSLFRAAVVVNIGGCHIYDQAYAVMLFLCA